MSVCFNECTINGEGSYAYSTKPCNDIGISSNTIDILIDFRQRSLLSEFSCNMANDIVV